MENTHTGRLIRSLRLEKGFTQKELADRLSVSAGAVSKWERGQGCPDISLLRALSEIFGVNIEPILSGRMDTNEKDGGNMKKVKFYVCPDCGNTLMSTGTGELSCCGRKLAPLMFRKSDEHHGFSKEKAEDDWYITFSHPMDKTHFITFAACVTYDRVLFIKLYPEQNGEVRFPAPRGKAVFYFHCNRDGLFSD